MNTYTFSYKNPKQRKLHYLKVMAKTEQEALKLAPKEIVSGNKVCLMYGLHGVNLEH